MFLNYVNSDDTLGQINVNRLIYRTSTLPTWWSDARACCAIANVLAHAPAMDEVVVISSEGSTESDGELPASTGLIFTPTKRPPSPDLGQLQVAPS